MESLQQLFTAIPPEQIDLPPFVLEYDARVSDCVWQASVFAPKCSSCASPSLLCKSFKGADFHILRMGRRRGGFLKSLVVLLSNDFLKFLFEISLSRGLG